MLLYILFAFTGAALGSYAGMVLFRTGQGISLLHPRSFCDNCRTTLPLRAIIPLAGFFLCGLHCRHCGKRSPFLYPTIEFLCIISAIIPLSLNTAPETAAFYWFLSYTAITVSLVDYKSGIVPLGIVLPGGGIALLFAATGISLPLSDAIIGGAAGWTAFYLIRLLSRGGSGLGDADFAAMLGLFLGWKTLVAVLITAFIAGGIWGGVYLIRNRRARKKRIPFTPFLSAATLVVLLCGNWVFKLYGWPV